MFCLNEYKYSTYVLSAHCNQKVLEPLELELWMIVNHHVGAENQMQILCAIIS